MYTGCSIDSGCGYGAANPGAVFGRSDYFERDRWMKKFIYGVALYPATVVAAWFLSSLSERFERALAEIDYELGLEDA